MGFRDVRRRQCPPELADDQPATDIDCKLAIIEVSPDDGAGECKFENLEM